MSLLYAGFYVKGVAEIGAGWATRQAQWPNVFNDEVELPETDKFKDPQIKWHQGYFDLADDEALVADVLPTTRVVKLSSPSGTPPHVPVGTSAWPDTAG